MRKHAPWTALTLVVLLCLVLVARSILVPANRLFAYGDGVRLQLLSIVTEGVDGEDRVAWSVAVNNGTGQTLDLSLSSTCRSAVSPLGSGPSALAVRGGERVRVPAPESVTVADSCPTPGSGRWWVYTVTLEDESGALGSQSVTFAGRAH